MVESILNSKIEEIEETIKRMRREGKLVLTLPDVVLLLLAAQRDKPIYSRIVLFKEVFLTYKEILSNYKDRIITEDPGFFGYKFGPYSYNLVEVLEQLSWSGYIIRRGRRSTRTETFLVTEAGVKRVKELMEKLPEELLDEIKAKRKGWDQLGVDGILRYVYTKYPEYKRESVLKNKYKELIWGGKG